MSIGTDRVRASFNPSGDSVVDQLKQKTAELIDLCERGKDGQNAETTRCAALAQTYYETAVMYAVKAATTS